MNNAQGQTYIELSMVDEVSITRSRSDVRMDYPAHAVVLCEEESLLTALQRLYPQYWISELTDLPGGDFNVAIIPRDGLLLNRDQQRAVLIRAFEESFKVKIQVNEDDRIATIKGRIF